MSVLLQMDVQKPKVIIWYEMPVTRHISGE